jgi:hypothetical protein
VKGSLGGQRELDDAVRGERWTSEGSSVFLSGALSGNEGEQVLREKRALKVDYRLNVDTKVIVFKGIPEGAMFRAPLDQDFFYPSRSETVSDASRLASSQYLFDGSFVPRGIAT